MQIYGRLTYTQGGKRGNVLKMNSFRAEYYVPLSPNYDVLN